MTQRMRLSLAAGLIVTAFVSAGARAQGCGVPSGTIIAYAGETIPSGWLVADGRPLAQADYPTLYDAIRTAHGAGLNESNVKVGDFNLPDLRGRFLRGVDQSQAGTVSGRDPDAIRRTAPRGNTGNNGNRVGSVQDDATAPPKTPFQIGGGLHQHSIKGDITESGNWNANVGRIGLNPQVNINTIPGEGVHTHTVSAGDSETRPKNVAVYFLICAR